MYRIGDKPGKGIFLCSKCGKAIVIENPNQTLPFCTLCDGIEFYKEVPDKPNNEIFDTTNH